MIDAVLITRPKVGVRKRIEELGNVKWISVVTNPWFDFVG
jgi:hypothetical protein